MSDIKIKVMIPVVVGGYTGQRDQWQEQRRDFVVTKNDDTITMTQVGGSVNTTVTFSKEALEQALAALGDKPAKPVTIYRSPSPSPTTGAEAIH